MNRSIIALALCMGLLCSSLATAGVLHVPGDYSQIHDAVQACAVGDTVLVAAGTFNDCTHPTEGPESTPACVIMKSGVTLRGAGPEATIIDAQGLGRGIFIEFVDNCRVENLQVTNAYAEVYGAGILIRNVDATVEINDVRVTTCTDGGVICIDNSSPTLRRVTMDHNFAKQGGGLAIEENSSPQVIDCTVDQNEAPSGAGVFVRNNCAPTFSDCFITNNTIAPPEVTNTYGGGISIQSSTPTITGCEIRGNTGNGFGGGVAYNDASAGLMEDCLIMDNNNIDSNGQGGGVFISGSSPVLRHLLIVDNTASGVLAKGGGVYIAFEPSPSLENCTIVGNACGTLGAGGGVAVEWFAIPSIDKCIISGSTVGEGMYCNPVPPGIPNPLVTCTNIFGNAGGDGLCGTDGGGNFSADPQFCGNAGYEYNLATSSPCAPGNHPDGLCEGALIGAMTAGCGSSPVPVPGAGGLVLGNSPNPFNPRTTIFFELPAAGPATLRIYNLAGRVVLERSWEDLPAGRNEFTWNGLNRQGQALASGVYLYRLDTRDQSLSRRMSLIR